MICGVSLAAMTAAGISHWWSVHQFAAAVRSGIPITAPGSSLPAPLPPAKPVAHEAIAINQPQNKPAPPPAPAQKEFFEALLTEVKNLRSQNLNLVDQMAETNRDLMKLEFRVDTHSESFRPLPVSEERSDTTFDDGPGVLPPRAEPVFPISGE